MRQCTLIVLYSFTHSEITSFHYDDFVYFTKTKFMIERESVKNSEFNYLLIIINQIVHRINWRVLCCYWNFNYMSGCVGAYFLLISIVSCNFVDLMAHYRSLPFLFFHWHFFSFNLRFFPCICMSQHFWIIEFRNFPFVRVTFLQSECGRAKLLLLVPFFS